MDCQGWHEWPFAYGTTPLSRLLPIQLDIDNFKLFLYNGATEAFAR